MSQIIFYLSTTFFRKQVVFQYFATGKCLQNTKTTNKTVCINVQFVEFI